MKTLIIGFDGASENTFKRGWTPFIESLIKKGKVIDLKEDLLSRGWVEIYTGNHATENGGMYEYPIMDGTYHFTRKFNLNICKESKNKKILEIISNKNYKVGIMNIPTTFPRPKINGFFVSGGGGESKNIISSDKIYPKKILNTLKKNNYIMDERIPEILNKRDININKFFQRYININRFRTNSFLELANIFKLDFGTIIFKSSIVATETILLPELERLNKSNKVNKKAISVIKNFYLELDKDVKKIVNDFKDFQIIFVSDHSMAVCKYKVNLNTILEKYGFQYKNKRKKFRYKFIQFLRNSMPLKIKNFLKNNSNLNNLYNSAIDFDNTSSVAFSITKSHNFQGIFINDKLRFNGIVPKEKIEIFIDQIINSINNDPEAKIHKIKAYRYGYGFTKEQKKFPDILVSMQEGYAPSNIHSEFIFKSNDWKYPFNLKSLYKDIYQSCKSYKPFLAIINNKYPFEKFKYKKKDLTFLYHYLNYYLEQLEKDKRKK